MANAVALPQAPAASAATLRARVARPDQALWDAWAALEGGAIGTPYQSAGFVRAWLACLPAGVEPWIVAVHRGDEEALAAVFPLQMERRGTLRVVTPCGGRHASYHGGLIRRDAHHLVSGPWLAQALQELARADDISALCLGRVPLELEGMPVALASLPGRDNPEIARSTALERDSGAWARRAISAHALGQLEKKLRHLARVHGEPRLTRARSPEEAARYLQLFLEQKSHFFAERGLPDPFASREAQRFLASAATAEPPVLEFYHLGTQELDLGVVAGMRLGGRYSLMLNSMVPRLYDKFSPGLLAILFLARQLCGEGISRFDLGIGDARYKATICRDVERLRDVAFGLTPAGKAYARFWLAWRGLASWAKEKPRLAGVLNKLRRMRAGT